MSNALAIAAVTATLRNLLEAGINGDTVLGFVRTTASPPDKARGNGDNDNQLNLFLYQTTLNAGWRNMDMPRQIKPGEVGQPPLPLNLHYMITAYARDNDDVLSHRILGRAMSVLHDHPLLGAGEIRAALADADLHNQVERIRITPEPLSLEELSKLWTTFQTQYRISAVYEATVVLIESQRAVRAALPVLTRGAGDRGPIARPDLTPPFPTLTSVEPPFFQPDALPGQQPNAQLGDSVILRGFHLDGDVTLRFTHPRLSAPLELPLPGQTNPAMLSFTVPNAPATWPAGIYGVSALIKQDGQERVTNTLALALAPTITLAPTDGTPGDFALTVTCAPQVLPDQRVALLFGDREIAAAPRTTATDTLNITVPDVALGEYYVRLRVDGVDSMLINRAVSPPAFFENQKVTIHE
jgi:hypothetical protein